MKIQSVLNDFVGLVCAIGLFVMLIENLLNEILR